MNSIQHIDPQVTTITTADVTENEQYHVLLESLDISFKEKGPYLDSGRILETGWVLDISVILSQFSGLVKKIGPTLANAGIGFRIPRDASTFVHFTSAGPGYEHFGKMISIYPLNSAQAASIAQKLIQITAHVRGPVIPTAIPLGGTIYARFGPSSIDGARLPKNVSWPFSWCKHQPPSPLLFRKGKTYRLVETLKADVKGYVYKAISLKKWWRLQFIPCLIKEGRHDMSFDSSHRTIIDRLEMQRRIIADLQHKVNTPAVLDYFFEDGNAYLVTGFIEGRQLNDVCAHLRQLKTWGALDGKTRQKILGYLQAIILSIEVMHNEGFIHRDITPVNFLVDKEDTVSLIDLELVYNEQLFNGLPPFTFGTDGFMSPEQAKAVAPAASQDIYAIGALLIAVIGGIHPARLKASDRHQRVHQLRFIFQSTALADLVADCLSPLPEQRPTLNEIKAHLDDFLRSVNLPPNEETQHTTRQATPRQLIKDHITAFSSHHLPAAGGLWLSTPVGQKRVVANSSWQMAPSPWLFNGLSGTLYVLAEAKTRGHNLKAVEGQITAAWGYLEHHILNQVVTIPGGLYQGAYGVAIALAAAIRSGTVVHNQMTSGYLHQLLQQEGNGLSYSMGMAGRITSLIYCGNLVSQPFFQEQLEKAVSTLINAQEKNGAWTFPKDDQPSNSRQYFNLSQGAAGVISSLLKAYALSKDETLKKTIIKGVDWIAQNARPQGDVTYWMTHPRSRLTERWLTTGNLGIASALLEAYQVLGVPRYKELAESTLRGYPKTIICDDLTLHTGLCGLGLVYLRAAAISRNHEWAARAEHILNILRHTTAPGDNDCHYWMTDNASLTTADLMTGNAGVTFFLLCHDYPELLTNAFPI